MKVRKCILAGILLVATAAAPGQAQQPIIRRPAAELQLPQPPLPADDNRQRQEQTQRERDERAEQRRRARADQAPATNAFIGSEYFNGVWAFNMTGTAYGVSLGNVPRVQFTLRRESDGSYTGFSHDSRRPIVLFGRTVGNVQLRGVWMEMNGGAPSGRWGLVRFVASPTQGQLSGSFSISYRRPLASFSGGYPGATVRGTYLLNSVPRSPDIGAAPVRAAWSALVAMRRPFPHLEALYPSGQRRAALERWMGGHDSDPCGRDCLGPEPSQVEYRLRGISVLDGAERNVEFYGEAGLRVSVVRPGAAPQPLGQWRRIYNVARDNADTHRERFTVFVEYPRPYQFTCNRNGTASASWALPAGLWSDPLADLILEHRGTLYEKDLRRQGDDAMPVSAEPARFRAEFETAVARHGADAARPCIDLRLRYGFPGNSAVVAGDVSLN